MEENRKRLTAKRKFELYLEAKQKEANIGEILRRHGVHLNDLRRIEGQVEQAAIEALKGRHNGVSVSVADYTELVMVWYMLLKKSESLASRGRL